MRRYVNIDEFPIAKISFPDIVFTEKDVEEYLAEFEELFALEKPFVLCINTTTLKNIQIAFLRKQVAFLKANRPRSAKYMLGTGLLVTNAMVSTLISFILKFYTPISEVKIFDNFQDQRTWCDEKIKKHNEAIKANARGADDNDWQSLVKNEIYHIITELEYKNDNSLLSANSGSSSGGDLNASANENQIMYLEAVNTFSDPRWSNPEEKRQIKRFFDVLHLYSLSSSSSSSSFSNDEKDAVRNGAVTQETIKTFAQQAKQSHDGNNNNYVETVTNALYVFNLVNCIIQILSLPEFSLFFVDSSSELVITAVYVAFKMYSSPKEDQKIKNFIANVETASLPSIQQILSAII